MNLRAERLHRILGAVATVILFGWFLYLIRGGLQCWFDADDLMNLHYYWSRPWPALIKANLMFWSSYYRPGGGLFYRTIHALWGFHPLPFRIAALILLSIDFALLAVVVRQLTDSYWCSLMALVLVGINPAFVALYFDTGTIYDVLAYTFFWGTFALYVRQRRAGRLPGWGGTIGFLCLLAATLDCKEISVLLPVVVALYEVVWHPPERWQPAALWRWAWREGRFALLGALCDVAFILGKRYGPDSLWQFSAYRPHYSWAAYVHALSTYLSQLTYEKGRLSDLKLGLLLAAMLAVAAATRRRCLLWGFGFVLVGVLPLAFIAPRGGFAYFVPSVGWAVYASGLLGWVLEKAAGRRAGVRAVAQAVLLIAVAGRFAHWQRVPIEMHGHAARDMQGRFLRYQEQIRALIPAPRKGARILLLTDADRYDDWDVYFLIRLFYGDRSLEAERMVVWRQRNVKVDPASYDYVLDWKDGRFLLVSRKSAT